VAAPRSTCGGFDSRSGDLRRRHRHWGLTNARSGFSTTLTPLRQLSAKSAGSEHFSSSPNPPIVSAATGTPTLRYRRRTGRQNPPDGAIISYRLGADSRTVVLRSSTARARRSRYRQGRYGPVRRLFWLGAGGVSLAGCDAKLRPGCFRYSPPQVLAHDYPISAIYGDTPRTPLGPRGSARTYTVRLSADGQRYTTSHHKNGSASRLRMPDSVYSATLASE
jgi:hypothetical protein